METKASLKHLRVSPQKARLVIDLIRGAHVERAKNILKLSTKAISRDIEKLLDSAIANAENNNEQDIDKLFVKKAFVDHGPTMKRMRARAQGRGNVIRKRTSHITVILEEKN